MAVHLDVVTEFDRSSARNAAQDLQRALDEHGRSAGKSYGSNFAQGFEASSPALQKAIERASDAAAKLTIEERKLSDVREKARKSTDDLAAAEQKVSNYRTNQPHLTEEIKRAEADLVTVRERHSRVITQQMEQTERHTRANRDAVGAMRELSTEMGNLESGASGASQAVEGLGGSLGSVGAVGGPAIAAVVVGVEALASVAAAASQALLLIPGAVAAAGVAFGTLKIGLLGFDQALKDIRDPQKFAADLQLLSPAAAEAARALQDLLPAFDALKNATQDALFAGVGDQLRNLAATFLPTIQQATTGIASAFNEMFTGLTTQLMTPQTQQAIQTFLNNTVQAFHNLAPAVAPLTQALGELVKVGSSFLPNIATAAANAAQQFANFINQASQSGQLQKWLQEGLDVLGQLGPLALSVAKSFLELAPVGERIMPMLVTSIELAAEGLSKFIQYTTKFSPWLFAIEQSIKLVNDLQTAFTGIGPILNTLGEAVNALTAPLRAVAGVIGVDIPTAPTNVGAGGPRATTPLGSTFGMTVPRGTPGAVPKPGTNEWWIPPSGGPYSDYGYGPAGGIPGLPQFTPPPDRGKGGVFDPGTPGHGPIGPFQQVPTPGGGRGSSSSVPYPAEYGQPPAAGESIAHWRERMAVIDAGHTVAEKQAELDKLTASNTAQQSDIVKAQNELIQAKLRQTEAEQTLNKAQQPEIPYGPGYGAAPRPGETEQMYSAEQSLLEAQHKRMQAQSDLATLDKSGVGTASDLTKARNELAKAEKDEWEAQLRLHDAALKTTGQLGQLGAQIDADFGISKGIPGIIDNLVRMLANLAAAPMLGQLSATAASSPIQGGYGLMGIMGAQNIAAGLSPLGFPVTGGGGGGGTTATVGFGGSYPGTVSSPADLTTAGSRISNLYAFASSLQGTPYSQSLRNDCSGMVSELSSVALGLPPPSAGQRFNTTNEGEWLQSHGFQPGIAPPGANAFQVGWNPAPGNAGHTAATLPGGINAEQGGGGSSFTLGGPVGGASSQFPLHAYLPMGGGGGDWNPIPAAVPSAAFGAPQQQQPAAAVRPPSYIPTFGGGAPAAAAPATASTGNNNFDAYLKARPGLPSSMQKTADAYWISKGFTIPGAGAGGGSAGPFGGDLVSPTSFGYGGAPATPAPGAPTTPGGPINWNAAYAPGGSPGGPINWGAVNQPTFGTPHLGAAGGSPGPGNEPTVIGGLAPPTGTGPGGVGITPGGSLDTAMGMAASAVPGLGQAAQTAAKLGSRFIQYGGQVAGILAQGAMETFLPTGGSELASKNWITRVVGGLAGARPALPNVAGKQTLQAQQGQQPGQPGQQQGPPPITVNYTNQKAPEDRAGADLTNHLNAMYQGVLGP